MNETELREWLDRAAVEVEPRSPVHGSTLRARAGRQHTQHLAVFVAAAVTVGVVAAATAMTVDFGGGSATGPNTSNAASPASASNAASTPVAPGQGTAPYKGVSLPLPAGWTQQTADKSFDPCTAKPNTIYIGGAMSGVVGTWGAECKSTVPQPWAWIADDSPQTLSDSVTPQTTVFAGGGLGFVYTTQGTELSEPGAERTPPPEPGSQGGPGPSETVWSGEMIILPLQRLVVGLFADDPAVIEGLRAGIAVPAPARQALVLPKNASIVDGAVEVLSGPFAMGTKEKLAAVLDELRALPPVDPSQACAWQNDGGDWVNPPEGAERVGGHPLGIDVQTTDRRRVQIIVSGDPKCLQAVSSDGGRVRVEAGTAQRLYDMVASGK